MIVLLIVLLVMDAAFLMIAFTAHRLSPRVSGRNEPGEQK
jgi:hypothetical protein